MSASNIPITSITVTHAATSGKSKRLKYNEIQVSSQLHKLTQLEGGSLHQQFPSPIELTPTCRITLYRPKPWICRRKSLDVDVQSLFASTAEHQMQELSITQNNIQVTFTRHLPDQPESSTGALIPTTQTILDLCPQFRILVIGKTGVGKSSLINEAFGIGKANASRLQRGLANITDELVSPDNPRFVLHDSVGFEPGDKNTYENVKNFIRSKKDLPLKDQLHAIWFCITTPRSEGRLLEAAAEEFFQSKRDTLGNIPIVVVFTKIDVVMNHETMELFKSHRGQLSPEDIVKKARSKTESLVQDYRSKIAGFAGDPDIPYAAVSTNGDYKHTLSSLINQTYRLVGATDTANANVASAVTAMAQRVNPHLNIQGSIDIGKQRYWRTLVGSSVSMRDKIQDYLYVIHTDIINVWNFYDPERYLLSDNFKQLLNNTVSDVQATPSSNSVFTLIENDLVAAISRLAGTTNTRPIALSTVTKIAADVWDYDILQNVRIVQQKFIAYIVNLTHIMETLFMLTGDHQPLTRHVIKFAYQAYCESNVIFQAHERIKAYGDLSGRDAAVNVIESLINPKRSDSDLKNYYAETGKLNLLPLDLGQDEDW